MSPELINDIYKRVTDLSVSSELINGIYDRVTDLSGNARNHKGRLEEKLAQSVAGGKGAASLR